MTTRLLRRRPARVVPAVTIAIVLLALAVLIGWAAVAAIVKAGGTANAAIAPSHPVLTAIGEQTWGSPAVMTAGAVVLALGIIVLLTAVVPGRLRIAAHQKSAPPHVESIEVALPSSTLAALAAAAADSVDGVTGVKVSSSSTTTDVTFTTPLRDTREVHADVEAAVRKRFDSIDFYRPPHVRVHAQRSKQ